MYKSELDRSEGFFGSCECDLIVIHSVYDKYIDV